MLGGRAERVLTNNPYVRHVPSNFRGKKWKKRWLVEFQINIGRINAARLQSKGNDATTAGLLKLQNRFDTNSEAQQWRNRCLHRHGVRLIINADGMWEQVPIN